MSYTNSALNAYKTHQTDSLAATATPYQVVKMLFESLQDNLARAKGAMERSQLSAQGHAINRCLDILGCLRSSLDTDVGGETAENLAELYRFCSQNLLTANRNKDVEKLSEAGWIITELQNTWHELGEHTNA